MSKNELIEQIQTAQKNNGLKVNAASTLKSKTVGQLEALLADLSCGGCENGEHCGSCDCCAETETVEAPATDKPMNRKACAAALKANGYEGPTSFLMPVLRELTRLVMAGTDATEALNTAKAGRKLR